MATQILNSCYNVLSSYRDYKRIGNAFATINKEIEQIIRSSPQFHVYGNILGAYKTLSDFSIIRIDVFPNKIIVEVEKEEKPFRYSGKQKITDSKLLQKIIKFKDPLTDLTKNNNNFSKVLEKISVLSIASIGLGVFGLFAEMYFDSYSFTSIKTVCISTAILGASIYLSAPGPKCYFNDNA
ncbi:MAG: hypothetical protein K1060chlam3_00706 [Candidatus Anoxychlamydiales bacterium]|nr:hypothetical protein [Candidatus Anoxychlamydiales bacterium]